ncbi:hypothetical protein ASH00_13170 [Arthrobacter sp. Soil782]|uniref:DUF4233 domain-containing protein n=1 Tax=Arthrobacter sp. Soil782 TaxID=1736410 RepID=UPI0007006D20|nr:DUF4233 domain-containing protein [Arthrobacter sp. Soil782]KRF04566.1 hypothetical protein ASH00_13170 [Arthrobacter sp. Soil782]
MARQTKAQREWRPGMPKKRRSVKVMFASTVLLLEAFVVLFATLVVFGLRSDTIPVGVILGVGLTLSAVLIVSCALLTKPYGILIGWILQVLIIATGIAEPMMFLVGILFALTWLYGIRTGARLDRENAQRDREQAEWDQVNKSEGDNGQQSL